MNFLQYWNKPSIILSSKPLVLKGRRIYGWHEDVRASEPSAVPMWWCTEYHVMVESPAPIGNMGFKKYCTRCDKELTMHGCRHNLEKVKKNVFKNAQGEYYILDDGEHRKVNYSDIA